MENYILITTLVLLAGTIYLVFSRRKNNDAEINELKESLTKVLVKMEEDNKQLRQNYIDEKINMEKLVLGIVKENTASQEKSFKTESENLMNSINSQTKYFSEYFTKMDSSISNLDNVTKDMKTEINDFSKIIGAS